MLRGARRWRRGEVGASYAIESIGTGLAFGAVGFGLHGAPPLATLLALGMGGAIVTRVASDMRRLDATDDDASDREQLAPGPSERPDPPENRSG